MIDIEGILNGIAVVIVAITGLMVAKGRQEQKVIGEKVALIDLAVNNRPAGSKTIGNQVEALHGKEFPEPDVGLHPLVHQIAADLKTLLDR